MELKVAIVGCGKIADGHVEEIQKIGTARLVAVCDRELLMAEQLAVRYHIRSHYDDFEQMLDVERPDVVHITTPPESHLALAMTALNAGCHIFVEKPLATNHEDAQKLVGAVEASDKKLTIGYTYRFDPPALAVREMIRKGFLGDIVHVESYYGYDLAGAYGKSLLGSPTHWVHCLPGKLFQNNIDHMLEKIVEYLPDDFPTVRALGYRREHASYGDIRDDLLDELRVMILGKATSAYATFCSHARPVGQFARIYGSKNTAHIDYVSRTVTFDSSPKFPSALGRVFPPFAQSWQLFREGSRNVLRFAKSEFHFFSGLNRLIVLFYESIIRDVQPPVPYRDILRVSRMTDEIIGQVFEPGSVQRK
jgi:predicted dehydrogenase